MSAGQTLAMCTRHTVQLDRIGVAQDTYAPNRKSSLS